jgi:pimeloyl-ACP methyl ester carboxylesterase
VTTVIVHGAGSTGGAAATLLGAGADAVLIEDRSGDVDAVIASLEATLAGHPDCSVLVGISLGAHAVARWASTSRRPLPRLVCVLPAWTGPPGPTAGATALAAQQIAADGATAVLDRLTAEGRYPDVVQLLRVAWRDYSDDALSAGLTRASTGRGPTPAELASISVPVAIVGWRGDALHPAAVTHEWAQYLRWPTIALAARPEIRLIRQALATRAA